MSWPYPGKGAGGRVCLPWRGGLATDTLLPLTGGSASSDSLEVALCPIVLGLLGLANVPEAAPPLEPAP